MLTFKARVGDSQISELIRHTAEFVTREFIDRIRAEARHDKGIKAYKACDLKGALEYFTEAAEKFKSDSVAHLFLGITRYDSGNLPGALEALNTAINLNPNDPVAYYNRGAVRNDGGDWDNAVADFEQVIILTPDGSDLQVDAIVSRGIARGNKGDYDGQARDETLAKIRNPHRVNQIKGLRVGLPASYTGLRHDTKEANISESLPARGPVVREITKRRRYTAGRSVNLGIRVKEQIKQILIDLTKARQAEDPTVTVGQVASELLEEAAMQKLSLEQRRQWAERQVEDFRSRINKQARLD